MRNSLVSYFVLSVIFITNCKEKVRDVDLGGKYRLIHSAIYTDLAIVKEYNVEVISGHILEYAFDSSFIIAVQRPRDSVAGMETMTANEYEEAFEKIPLRLYWIIDKTTESVFNEKTLVYSNVFGPFKIEEYIEKRKELKIPEKLIMNKNKMKHLNL